MSILILKFDGENSASLCLADVELRSMELLGAAGFPVDSDLRVVYGIKRDTGEVDYDSATERWDTVKAHPDGGFYFASPRRKYPHHFDYLTAGHSFTEVDYEKAGE